MTRAGTRNSWGSVKSPRSKPSRDGVPGIAGCFLYVVKESAPRYSLQLIQGEFFFAHLLLQILPQFLDLLEGAVDGVR